MNVTKQINKSHLIYGSSDYTAPHRTAAGKALNYAKGASIHKPEQQTVGIVPYTLKYQGQTGLFGAENYFVKINLDIRRDATYACYEELYWQCGNILYVDRNPEDIGYNPGLVQNLEMPIDNTFVQAEVNANTLPVLNGLTYLSIDLNNIKTGVHQNDEWLDVRLYTSDRIEHPYDKMYIRPKDFFYIGFHARNTRRLNYNVECLIGAEYLTFAAIEDKKYIMNTIKGGPNY